MAIFGEFYLFLPPHIAFSIFERHLAIVLQLCPPKFCNPNILWSKVSPQPSIQSSVAWHVKFWLKKVFCVFEKQFLCPTYLSFSAISCVFLMWRVEELIRPTTLKDRINHAHENKIWHFSHRLPCFLGVCANGVLLKRGNWGFWITKKILPLFLPAFLPLFPPHAPFSIPP